MAAGAPQSSGRESAVMELRPGACYSNGEFGRHWSVRQVISLAICGEHPEPCVHYKVLAGAGRRQRFSCGIDDFLGWVRYEVVRHENEWERIDVPAS